MDTSKEKALSFFIKRERDKILPIKAEYGNRRNYLKHLETLLEKEERKIEQCNEIMAKELRDRKSKGLI